MASEKANEAVSRQIVPRTRKTHKTDSPDNPFLANKGKASASQAGGLPD
jgi:hypothetical protein